MFIKTCGLTARISRREGWTLRQQWPGGEDRGSLASVRFVLPWWLWHLMWLLYTTIQLCQSWWRSSLVARRTRLGPGRVASICGLRSREHRGVVVRWGLCTLLLVWVWWSWTKWRASWRMHPFQYHDRIGWSSALQVENRVGLVLVGPMEWRWCTLWRRAMDCHTNDGCVQPSVGWSRLGWPCLSSCETTGDHSIG